MAVIFLHALYTMCQDYILTSNLEIIQVILMHFV